jgi:hypothetical protein
MPADTFILLDLPAAVVCGVLRSVGGAAGAARGRRLRVRPHRRRASFATSSVTGAGRVPAYGRWPQTTAAICVSSP